MNNVNIEELRNKIKEHFSEVIIDNVLESLTNKQAFTTLVEQVINAIMLAEREVYTEHNHESKNGFSSRTLNTKLDKLNISVPRTRTSDFRPSILPEKYKRNDDSFFSMLETLIASGHSKNKIKTILKDYGVSYSEELYEEIGESIDTKLKDFQQQELEERMLFVYIDGYVCEIKEKATDKVRKGCIYTVIGINFECKKQILGYYITYGNETKSDWLKILHDLVNRKLKEVLLFICDDFVGITEAIKEIYPKADIQKCYLHLMKNVRRKLAKKDSEEVIQELKIIKDRSKNYEEGEKLFDELCEKNSKNYKSYMEYLKSKKEEYLRFLKYPKEIRKYIYTTNVVENFNSLIEKERIRLGGYFQSKEIAERTIFLLKEHLIYDEWKLPNPIIKNKIYDLYQMYQVKYSKQE